MHQLNYWERGPRRVFYSGYKGQFLDNVAGPISLAVRDLNG